MPMQERADLISYLLATKMALVSCVMTCNRIVELTLQTIFVLIDIHAIASSSWPQRRSASQAYFVAAAAVCTVSATLFFFFQSPMAARIASSANTEQ